MSNSKPGFNTTADLSSAALHTPPDTPRRAKKRPPSRPGSRGSSHRMGEISPASKVAERSATATDDLSVEELSENDVGYHTDLDVVHPYEIEEFDSDSNSNDGNAPVSPVSDADASDTGLTRHLSRLRCGDGNGDTCERTARPRNRSRKAGSRVYKRTHSQTVDDSDADFTDPDTVADQDFAGGQRRLRRRIVRPDMDAGVTVEDVSGESLELAGSGKAGVVMRTSGPGSPAMVSWQFPTSGDDAMDVDIAH